MSDSVMEQIKDLLTKLTPLEKAEVITLLGSALKTEIPDTGPAKRQSAYGLWADLGTGPSAEEIDEARHDLWGNFPRNDI